MADLGAIAKSALTMGTATAPAPGAAPALGTIAVDVSLGIPGDHTFAEPVVPAVLIPTVPGPTISDGAAWVPTISE